MDGPSRNVSKILRVGFAPRERLAVCLGCHCGQGRESIAKAGNRVALPACRRQLHCQLGCSPSSLFSLHAAISCGGFRSSKRMTNRNCRVARVVTCHLSYVPLETRLRKDFFRASGCSAHMCITRGNLLCAFCAPSFRNGKVRLTVGVHCSLGAR